MKRILLSIALAAFSLAAHAQFSPNTPLSATALNNALAAPNITGGSINGSTPILTTGAVTLNGTNVFGANTSATTQSYLDNSTNVATTQFVKRTLLATTATIPMVITGGTYNFATVGTGAIFGVMTSGGALASVTGIVAGGVGYSVGDVLTMIGGNGDGLVYVNNVSSGVITAATIFYGGTGYSGTPQLSGQALPPGSRTGNLTGTLTSNATIIIPGGTLLAGARRIGFQNNTTGAFSITVKLTNGAGGSTGTGVVLPQGAANNTSLMLYTNGTTDVWPEINSAPSFIIPGTLTLQGVNILPVLSGVTASLGGSNLATGACASVTATVTGATTSMSVNITPQTYPGAGFFWRGYVSSTNTVTATVCSALGGMNAPTASLYNIRVSQ